MTESKWDKLCIEMDNHFDAILGGFNKIQEKWIQVRAEGDKLQQENKALRETNKIANEVLDAWKEQSGRHLQKLEAIRKYVKPNYKRMKGIDFSHQPEQYSEFEVLEKIMEMFGE